MAYVRQATPIPGGLPLLRPLSYATTTNIPLSISRDRKTLYGSNGTTGLVQSGNDGTTWVALHTFAQNVVGLIETDDGEAVCICQSGAASPGYIYKSSGWSASHIAATWTLELTTSGGYIRTGFHCHNAMFGNDNVNPGTSKYGVAAEYGSQTVTGGAGPNATTAHRVFFTQDYGVTWPQVLDIYTFFGSAVGLHVHGTCYDPWWDRIWVTFGDNQQNSPLTDILYSDDHGTTWTQMAPPPEWSGLAPFQETTVFPTEDAIFFGADNGPGMLRVSRAGYRKTGQIQILGQEVGHSSSQQVHFCLNRNRNQPGAPLFSGDSSVSAFRWPGISVVTDNLRISDAWIDPTLQNNGNKGVFSVMGPTYNGIVVAWVVGGAGSTNYMLTAELLTAEPGAYDCFIAAQGDGTTTAFSVNHGLPYTPLNYDFIPWSLKAFTGGATLTATSTQFTATFAAAPASTDWILYAIRAR